MLLAAIDPDSFLAVVGTAALAGTLATMITSRGVLVPTVVAEFVLGVVIGPQVLGLEVTEFMQFFADLGLGMLFFFAGYEIDLKRIAGLPLRLAVAAGAAAEGAWRLLGRSDDPPMTRFLAHQLATAHWFDISAARRDLGFVPQVGLDEGLRRLSASLAAA